MNDRNEFNHYIKKKSLLNERFLFFYLSLNKNISFLIENLIKSFYLLKELNIYLTKNKLTYVYSYILTKHCSISNSRSRSSSIITVYRSTI